MASNDVEEKVRTILQRVGKLEPGFSAQADIFRELGVKSAAALDLLLSLEEDFGITISDDAFAEARTTEKIIALVNGLKGVAA
jgi:acyl carrier protein